MAGCLLIVATPIGNLEDMTLRALRVLREADVIAAEDTRRTARLLQHYSISTPTTSLHEHNERQKIPMILGRLDRGDRVALVSDAGTPTVSDPGTRLVKAALESGIRVEPIPGPSAIMAALSVSGFEAEGFTFAGFPPTRSKDRRGWFASVAANPRTLVFFEAPHRIARTLLELSSLLGDRPIVAAREMTKVHEQLVKGPINAVLEHLQAPRGEFVIVVGPQQSPPGDTPAVPEDEHLWVEFGHMIEKQGLSRREAITQLSKSYRLRARDVYRALERAKELGHKP